MKSNTVHRVHISYSGITLPLSDDPSFLIFSLESSWTRQFKEKENRQFNLCRVMLCDLWRSTANDDGEWFREDFSEKTICLTLSDFVSPKNCVLFSRKSIACASDNQRDRYPRGLFFCIINWWSLWDQLTSSVEDVTHHIKHETRFNISNEWHTN